MKRLEIIGTRVYECTRYGCRDLVEIETRDAEIRDFQIMGQLSRVDSPDGIVSATIGMDWRERRDFA